MVDASASPGRGPEGRTPGERIAGLAGAYVVRKKQGEGAFGITWLVDDAASGAAFVLKELRLDRVHEWKALELFEREGRVLEALHHPLVPRYRDFFATDGERPFPVGELTSYAGTGRLSLALVQEYVSGETLAARIDRGAPFSADEIERVLRDLLGVLAYLHGLAPPVLHRDVSPRNVILDPAGRAHLVDFGGVQHRIRAAGSAGSTTVGTMGYAPLEQMRGDARPASDLHALGMTLLHAASGVGPDAMPVDEETAKPDVEKLVPTLPARVRRVLGAMVEPAVGRRIASAREAIALLDAKEERPRRAEPAAPQARPQIAYSLVGAVLAVAMGGAVWLTMSRAPDRVGARAVTTSPPSPQATPVSPPTTAAPRPSPKAPSAPPAPAIDVVWHARVATAQGIALAPGAACNVSARAAPGPRIDAVKIACGSTVLYDSTVQLEGVSMTDEALGEEATATGLRAWLAYSDTGNRASRAQTRIDTRLGKAQAFRDDLRDYHVTLTVDRLSEPHDGPALAQQSP